MLSSWSNVSSAATSWVISSRFSAFSLSGRFRVMTPTWLSVLVRISLAMVGAHNQWAADGTHRTDGTNPMHPIGPIGRIPGLCLQRAALRLLALDRLEQRLEFPL